MYEYICMYCSIYALSLYIRTDKKKKADIAHVHVENLIANATATVTTSEINNQENAVCKMGQ